MAAMEVLNAFRHHWNLHQIPNRVDRIVRRCSTPFGIIGIFTRYNGRFRRGAARSAQRLSASLESSPGIVTADFLEGLECSTPFGIIGIFTG